MTPEQAKESVNDFLDGAKRIMLREMEATLREIAAMPWWRAWTAPDLAAKCLGIYKYWNKGFKR